MNLNLASGNHYQPWWGVNVDLYFDADVRADAGTLPFRDHAFERVYLGHFLEHVPWAAIPAVLAEVRRVTVPGGEVTAVGPCIHLAIQTAQPRWLIEAILSNPQTVDVDPGVHHAWTPTEDLTVEAMRRGGFLDAVAVPITTVDRPTWPNPTTAAWQCAVAAHAPL